VRFTEPLEDYNHHIKRATENGIEYGDFEKYLTLRSWAT